MKQVSMLKFRKNARSVIQKVEAGERMLLTYRGEPAIRLEPVNKDRAKENDPFYKLSDLAEEGQKSMSNKEIDRTVYGK